MHHAPFIVTSIISVSLVTELISDRSKHALPSKIISCSFFTDSYPKSLTIFISRRRRDLSLGHFGDGGGGGGSGALSTVLDPCSPMLEKIT